MSSSSCSTGIGIQAFAATLAEPRDEVTSFIDEIDAVIAGIRAAAFTLTRPTQAAVSVRHRLVDMLTELEDTLPMHPTIHFSGPVDLFLIDELADDVLAVVPETLANISPHARAEAVVIDVTVAQRRGGSYLLESRPPHGTHARGQVPLER
ncbi:hypothetical protein ITJ64_05335 [Herbiconiux sp. VKM Ac-1786]|uniref:hypothetical protein n=1 Tax=Herbiconiux sp. VKM Ac-1786 TaxID=2783824 RepID=UPI00188ABE6F|nr:hypothetical protein [Herbiconiux sp. VKM Ac-1786]MBF4571934.1 hypothetical protein [Herbiconiux sp. VKM Ac-1786]